MAIRIELTARAERDLKRVDRTIAARILAKLKAIEEAGEVIGDVKRLTGRPPRSRLRIGDYRVLFRIERDTLLVVRIAHRREVYE